ncbi:MAG: DUF3592 domain-containing protein [Candidatus Obscuribacterales bacterium]|nr:DUF3592 domain-containing protein [Candidatus Obscuribacterales bacterium]
MKAVFKFLDYVLQLLRVAIAVVVLGVAVFDCSNGLESSRWPTVNGTVLSAKMKKVESGSGTRDEADSGYQYADISYQYKVNGKTFTSDCVQIGGLCFRDQDQILRKYNSLKTVLVHYSPNSPSTSCLETGFNFVEVIGCLLIVLFMGHVIGGIRKLIREPLSLKSIVMSERAKLSVLAHLCDTKFGAGEMSEPDRNALRTLAKRRRVVLPILAFGFFLLIQYAREVKLPGINSDVLVVLLLLGGGLGLGLLFSLLPVVIAHAMRARWLKLAAAVAKIHSDILNCVSPLSAGAAIALGLRAEVAQERLQYSQARSLSERALNVCLSRHESHAPPTSHDEYTNKMLERQLEINQKQLTELEPVCRDSLGTILFDMGLYEESLTHAKRAVAIAESCLENAAKNQSDSARLCLANALSLKGRVENMVGSLDAARKDLERSISLRQQLKRQFDERWALTLAYLSSTYSMQSESKNAAATIEEGFALLKDSKQPAYLLARATLLFHRAEARLRSRQLRYAQADLQECLKLRQELLEPGHPEIAATYLVFAKLDEMQGRLSDSVAKRESAREMLFACFGNNHPLCDFAKADKKSSVGFGAS